MIGSETLGRAACGLALFLAVAAPSRAGSFSVSPVRATLSAGQPVAALTVRNDGSESTVVQLELSQWSQSEDRDVQVPTTEILATPPIFTIAPGKTQVVRVGLRRAPDPRSELTYRLALREVPAGAPSRGLQVALLISLPVFVHPPGPVTPELQWHAVRQADGRIALHARNAGNAHVQISQLELAAAKNGEPLATQSVAQYILPGSTRSFVLNAHPAAARGSALRVRARTDAGEMQASVAVEDEPARPRPRPLARVAP